MSRAARHIYPNLADQSGPAFPVGGYVPKARGLRPPDGGSRGRSPPAETMMNFSDGSKEFMWKSKEFLGKCMEFLWKSTGF